MHNSTRLHNAFVITSLQYLFIGPHRASSLVQFILKPPNRFLLFPLSLPNREACEGLMYSRRVFVRTFFFSTVKCNIAVSTKIFHFAQFTGLPCSRLDFPLLPRSFHALFVLLVIRYSWRKVLQVLYKIFERVEGSLSI